MIELPVDCVPNDASPEVVDFGGVLRPATGGRLQRVNRGGKRFRVSFTLPVREGEDARPLISDLMAAQSEGLRVEYPLQSVNQGLPGSPVVDGAGQSGTTINLRGLTPRYAAKKGFWLSIVDGNGQHYLHNVRTAGFAGADGKMALAIQPPLRVPFPDGAAVHLAKPMIEGLVEAIGWHLGLGDIIDSISFVVEEAA